MLMKPTRLNNLDIEATSITKALCVGIALLLAGCSPDKWYSAKEDIQYSYLQQDSAAIDRKITDALHLVEDNPKDVRKALEGAGMIRTASTIAGCDQWAIHIPSGDKRNPPGLDIDLSFCAGFPAGQRAKVTSRIGDQKQ
jgi:hypothetical protein